MRRRHIDVKVLRMSNKLKTDFKKGGILKANNTVVRVFLQMDHLSINARENEICNDHRGNNNNVEVKRYSIHQPRSVFLLFFYS